MNSTPAALTSPVHTPMNYAQSELYRVIAHLHQTRTDLAILDQMRDEGLPRITLHSASGQSVTLFLPQSPTLNLIEECFDHLAGQLDTLTEQEVIACQEVVMLHNQEQEATKRRAAAKKASFDVTQCPLQPSACICAPPTAPAGRKAPKTPAQS